MYWRNCGSNCPRSWALIARSTRGSALIGPGPISSRGAGLMSCITSLFMRMVLQPVASDVDAPREVAFLVEDVEGVLEIGEELIARVEPLGRGEAHVVRVQRIRDDELRLAALVPVPRVVPRQVVAVVVGVVDEAAVLRHELARIRAGAAGVPAERALAGELAVNLDRALHVLALERFRHVLVIDPAPAVARDLVPRLE